MQTSKLFRIAILIALATPLAAFTAQRFVKGCITEEDCAGTKCHNDWSCDGGNTKCVTVYGSPTYTCYQP